METKYYVDSEGSYIGGFCGEAAMALVPEDAAEVPGAPLAAWWIWNGEGWDELPPPE